MLTATHTRTFNVIRFADPYKTCDACGQRITGVLDGTRHPTNVPCEHRAGYTDRCPSWSPVDGCLCAEHLGEIPHAP